MIITVGNTKGGVGKTTLAVNLAIARALDGKDVWLIDGDRQGTAQTAIRVRDESEQKPRIACATYSDGAAIGVYAALSATGSSINVSDSLKNISKNLDAKSKSDYSAIDWYLSAFKKYATFTGRAQRKEFWFYMLFYVAAIIVLSIIDSVLFGLDGMHLFSTLFMLASIVPSVAVAARRLHDIGKSGWWQLLALIPLVGTIILIIWFAKEGDAADNAYGPNPLL